MGTTHIIKNIFHPEGLFKLMPAFRTMKFVDSHYFFFLGNPLGDCPRTNSQATFLAGRLPPAGIEPEQMPFIILNCFFDTAGINLSYLAVYTGTAPVLLP